MSRIIGRPPSGPEGVVPASRVGLVRTEGSATPRAGKAVNDPLFSRGSSGSRSRTPVIPTGFYAVSVGGQICRSPRTARRVQPAGDPVGTL